MPQTGLEVSSDMFSRRRLIARPSGGSFSMPNSGRSKPSMGISRCSAPISMRSASDKHLTELLAAKI